MRIVCGAGEPAGQPEEALVMGIEQRGEASGGVFILPPDGRRHRNGLPAHTCRDAPGARSVGLS